MSLEHGGKADKDGNKYECEWVIYNSSGNKSKY